MKADKQSEGHTQVRCKAEKAEINAGDNAGANGFHDVSVPESNDAPTETVGDWNAGGDSGMVRQTVVCVL